MLFGEETQFQVLLGNPDFLLGFQGIPGPGSRQFAPGRGVEMNGDSWGRGAKGIFWPVQYSVLRIKSLKYLKPDLNPHENDKKTTEKCAYF